MRKLIFLITAILFTACSNIEKDTHKVLLKSERDFMDQECRLNGFFQNEPEFYTFTNTQFCSGELEITNLQTISESESIVDYKITFKAKQSKLKKWLRAYESMADRKLPSPKQQQIKALIEKIATEQRDWVYNKQTVKLSLTDTGWIVEDIIH